MIGGQSSMFDGGKAILDRLVRVPDIATKRSTMAIEFDCPACDATIRVKDDAAGKKGRCPKCKVLLLVPDPGPEPEDEPEEAPPPSIEQPPALAESAETIEEPAAVSPRPVEPPLDLVEAPTVVRLPTTSGEPPSPVEEPVEEDLIVVSTPTPTPLPVVADSPIARVGRGASRRGSRRRSSSGLLPAVIAVIGFLVVAGGAWFAYRMTLPNVPDVITADRYRNVGLPPARFAAPGSDAIAAEVRESVMKSLASEGLPLKSGFVEVWLNAEGEELVVEVSPGPRSNAVRVPLGELDSIRSMLARERDHIATIKSRELRRSTADFFRDYAAYLDSGTAMARLPEYRDNVALNAATGVTGYAVEAIVGSTPFLCVYEDSTGGCYFFPPKETQKFRIRGRKLADGKTPLPIEIEVVLKDAEEGPPVSEEEAEQSEAEDTQKKDGADENHVKPDEATDTIGAAP